MAYRNNLKWMKQLNLFKPEEQKVLLALSHDKYEWRTRDRLIEITGFEPSQLDSLLSELIEKDFVRPSFSKTKNIIFGLREVVG